MMPNGSNYVFSGIDVSNGDDLTAIAIKNAEGRVLFSGTLTAALTQLAFGIEENRQLKIRNNRLFAELERLKSLSQPPTR